MAELAAKDKNIHNPKYDFIMLEPNKMIDDFSFDHAVVNTEATAETPAQRITSLRHVPTGTDCYLAMNVEASESDQEQVNKAKIVLQRSVAEATRFDVINSTDQLANIHQCIGKYPSVPDAQALATLRREYRQHANQFPQIPENLNQIDLAATWSWHIQQMFKKSDSADRFFEPIPKVDLDIGRVIPVRQLPDENKPY